MAKKFFGKNSLAFLMTLFKGELTKKVDVDDSRLSDARKPLDHAADHSATGSDPINPRDINAVPTADVVDALNSDSSTKVLSAKQGNVLLNMINNIDVSGGNIDEIIQQKGEPNGIAPLDNSGKVDSKYLPSYIDEAVEGYYADGKFYSDSSHTTEVEGDVTKIYVDKDTTVSYRYSGTVFVAIVSNDMIECSNTEIEDLWNGIMATGNAKVISFTIRDGDNAETYYTTENNTWANWINSVYNTDGFALNSDGHVSVTVDGTTKCLSGVMTTSRIVDKAVYELSVDA